MHLVQNKQWRCLLVILVALILACLCSEAFAGKKRDPGVCTNPASYDGKHDWAPYGKLSNKPLYKSDWTGVSWTVDLINKNGSNPTANIGEVSKTYTVTKETHNDRGWEVAVRAGFEAGAIVKYKGEIEGRLKQNTTTGSSDSTSCSKKWPGCAIPRATDGSVPLCWKWRYRIVRGLKVGVHKVTIMLESGESCGYCGQPNPGCPKRNTELWQFHVIADYLPVELLDVIRRNKCSVQWPNPDPLANFP